MKYFIHLSYDGSKYRGWQLQPDISSVQGKIENTLKRILKVETRVYGCGRTDAGVHASQYFLHFFIEQEIDFDLKFRLNKNLPTDIVVHDVLEMKGNEHARFDAISRTYDYFLHTYQDPVLNNHSTQFDLSKLNIVEMQKAIDLIRQQKDFKTICIKPALYKNTICNIQHVALIIDDKKERMRFTITADRFLQGMIRLCIFFLIEIGIERISIDEFKQMLKDELYLKRRSAPPNGLYLSRVVYPYINIEPHPNMCTLLKNGLEY